MLLPQPRLNETINAEIARQNAARVELANNQSSSTEVIPEVDVDILLEIREKNFKRDWLDAGNAFYNALYSNYNAETYVKSEALFIPEQHPAVAQVCQVMSTRRAIISSLLRREGQQGCCSA